MSRAPMPGVATPPAPIARTPITRRPPLPPTAIQRELRQIERALTTCAPSLRPYLLGARALARWVLVDGAPRASELYGGGRG